MTLAFYMDEHVPRPITVGLRLRGVDVLTAQEDEHRETDDAALLDRAAELGRVMFSFDADMLRRGNAAAAGRGLICWAGLCAPNSDFNGRVHSRLGNRG